MLRLRIVSDHRASLGSRAEKTLHAGDLTVGRGPENGWVLPDPDLLLSRQHCVFEKAGERYRVIDTSTNGVFLNGSELPLGRNAPAVLSGGDRVRIGRFIIEATIESLDAPSFTEIAGAFRGQSPGGAEPERFGDDPFASPGRGAPPPLPPFDFNDGPPIQPFGGEPLRGDRGAFPAWSADDASPQEPPFGAPQGEDWRFGTVDDHAPALNQSLRVTPSEPAAPVAPPSSSSLIPDDWDDLSLPIPEPPVAKHPVAAPDLPAVPPMKVPALPEDWDLDDPLADERAPEPPRPAAFSPMAAPSVPPPLPPLPAPVVAPPPLAPAPAVVPVVPVEAGSGAGVAAFLAGFGAPLPPGGVADGDAFLRGMGEALRVSLGALHASLQARSHFKDEFHLEQTSFRPAGENPLKRCADLGEAVEVLADPGRRGFLPMTEAVREAASDVQIHHLAYAAALQTALKQVVAKFDPQALSQRLETRLLDSLVPGARKARYWDQYEALYKDLVAELAEDFDRVVGDSIAAEYDRHVRSGGKGGGGDPP
ncbi:type VI secretion system-associated FHA domain protein TagH [Azospirillum doebereinerae]|uniref:type VI secretion system-associated FHA domain protein TagH n=1 Tax=Azospirillum doebereinerae TaxID=92933 RepID=UPI001EE58E41|nr:type VI secretion system-associated FHA domain protein TagH [Azospirillum doebereinerae]MCG5240454.1 type VI secretion system-associated FHA domain protein TagH [Azospirillum doebereinerae]